MKKSLFLFLGICSFSNLAISSKDRPPIAKEYNFQITRGEEILFQDIYEIYRASLLRPEKVLQYCEDQDQNIFPNFLTNRKKSMYTITNKNNLYTQLLKKLGRDKDTWFIGTQKLNSNIDRLEKEICTDLANEKYSSTNN
jgi:hypothetical protein